MKDLRKDIQAAINRNNAESGSDTPDFILADYLLAVLSAYDNALARREAWYGMKMTITHDDFRKTEHTTADAPNRDAGNVGEKPL